MADPPRHLNVRLPIPDDRSDFNKQLVGLVLLHGCGVSQTSDEATIDVSRTTDWRAVYLDIAQLVQSAGNGASVGFESGKGGGEEKEKTASEEQVNLQKSARATADDEVTAEANHKKKKKRKRFDSNGKHIVQKKKHTEKGEGSSREKTREKKGDDDPIGEKKRRREEERQDGPDKEPMCDRDRPGEKGATEAEEERHRLREAAVQLALSLPQQTKCKLSDCPFPPVSGCSLKVLRRHVALHHYEGPSLFRCFHCHFKANVRKSVRQHVQQCHSDADQPKNAINDRRSDKTWISIWQLVLSCFGVKEEEEEDEVDLMWPQLRERENAQPIEQSPMKSDCSSDCEWREEGAERQRGEKRRKREMVEKEDRERECRVDSDCSNEETDDTSEYGEVEMEQGDGPPAHSDHSSGEETGEEREEEEGVTRRKRVNKEGVDRGDDSPVSSDYVTSESDDEGEWETRRLRGNRIKKMDEEEGERKETDDESSDDSDIDSDETYEGSVSDTSRCSMREKEENEEDGGGKNVKRKMKGDKDLAARVKELGKRLLHGKYKCLFSGCEKVIHISATHCMLDHALVHYNGPSLFKCTLCSYRTNGLPCMWQHARVHGITSQTNRERPYVDLRTDKSAKICNTLILRCFGAHGEGCEKLRTVKCRICSSRVRRAFDHADIHLSPPGIYRCSGCGRGFNDRTHIRRHIAQCTAGASVINHRNKPEIAACLVALREECFPNRNWHHRTPKGKAAGGGKKKSGAKALARVVSGGSRTAKDSPIVVVSGRSHKATGEKAGGGDERDGRQSRTRQCNPRRRSAEQ